MTKKIDPSHHHKVGCYDDRVTCGRAQHTHIRTCWTQPDRRNERTFLTCSRAEHEHTGDCTQRFLICGNP